MKILLTGGGTGGHFYPIIAVAQAIKSESKERKLIPPDLYYMAPTPYNSRALFENDINFIPVSAGKVRRYFSIKNFFDLFKTFFGVMGAMIKLFRLYPDVVFGKGGYVSFPAVFAARILGIPVVIHESDSHPGRVNAWASKFAKRIAISYPEAGTFFAQDKVAVTGNPVRAELLNPVTEGAYQFLNLEQGIPTLFVLGGSQGSQNINEAILDALPSLVAKYQIIHQTGRVNFDEVKRTADVVLQNSPHQSRYKPFDYLDNLAMRMSAGAATLIISRAGSQIFEIAFWGLPSIIIPIPESVSHDQLTNAFSYARTGAAVVIEENNLTSEILLAEIDKILTNDTLKTRMAQAAKNFARPDAAKKIADEILNIALTHENN